MADLSNRPWGRLGFGQVAKTGEDAIQTMDFKQLLRAALQTCQPDVATDRQE